MEDHDSPQTIGRALDEYEAALFVGRGDEIYTFRRWLGETASPILNVYGRGGVGKSTLLSAFSRAARGEGRRVCTVDVENLHDSPERFWEALVPGAPDPASYIRDERALIFVDSYNTQTWLPKFLQDDVLGPLEADAKVVIAGRVALGPAWRRWRSLIRSIALDVLEDGEATRYLLRRGVTHRPTIDGIISTAAGLPLALSLAADIVTELGTVDLSSTTEWHLAVRTLVEQLLHDVADPELARLLEACSVVHHFDEPTLAAMTDTKDVSKAFAHLCSLSVVRAGAHGLTLHTDVRNAVADDLRWRNLELYTTLRERALTYLRGRMARATPDERHWLSAERMFLWENAFLHSVLFQKSGPSDVALTLGAPEDADEVLLVERRFQEEVLPLQARVQWTAGYSLEAMLEWLGRALRLDGARVVLVRDVRGRLTGYSLCLPIYRGSLDLLRSDPVHGAVLSRAGEDIPLVEHPDDATAHYLVRMCVLDEEPEATNAALVQDTLGLIALEGVYFTVAAVPLHKAILEALRFEPIGGATGDHWLPDHPFQGYVLDLRRVGFEAWIDALMADRAIVPRPDADELEQELAELLPVLDEDDRLATSRLAQIGGGDVRGTIRDVIAGLRADASSDLDLALRAVELAYLDRVAAHERIAERLSVSRSTFYRLLRRGTRALAEALSRQS